MPTFEIDKSFLIMKKDKYIRFDWAVKRLLRDKANFDVLEGLLTVLLDRQIHIIDILESESNQQDYDDKFNRVDIKARDSENEIIIVEVQVTRELYFLERILYGVAKAITEHMALGELYSEVKKVYSISILYFDIGKGNDYLYHGQNTFTGVHTGDHLQVTVKERDALVQRLPSEIFPEYFLIRVNGDKFSKAYDVTFTGRDNQLHHPFQTSWGVSTRLVGAIIMTHGDDDGLILPPAVAPIQVVVVPIAAHKPGVSEKAAELAEKISKYARVKLDDSDNAPGWKFSQWEMKGVPLRLEIGPKDLEKNQCVLVRRDTREKVFVSLDELETAIPAQLEALRKDLYERALANREKRTWAATTMDEVKELAKANTGYIKTMWCGDLACEMKMKEEAGLSSRCMPFEQEHLSDVCPCCGKPAKTMVYWGVAY